MSTSRATLPRRSPSNNSVIVMGRGRGLGAVLRAIRDLDLDLTVLVAVAERESEPSSALGPPAAAGELRRSLEALTDDRVALARALRRPLAIDRLGRHPLGNLMIQSLASAFGDLAEASTWLGGQLGIRGAVLPVTAEPIHYRLVAERSGGPGSSRIEFVPSDPAVAPAVLTAIGRAHQILLAPGSLYRSVLMSCAVPAVRAALEAAPGRIVRISNIDGEAARPPGDPGEVLRRHAVRVDAVLYDPAVMLQRPADRLARSGAELIPHRLTGPVPGVHDQDLLCAALVEIIGAGVTSRPSASRPD
jgi:2-phospho-L-lactate transferase/gluconeogenesis factor (CofD/UPF0052 family)